MNQDYLKKYAEFVVRIGVGVQPGQTLLINCPIDAAYFGRACAEVGYAAGARDVVVHYGDEKLARLRLQNAALPVLEEVKDWTVQKYMAYVEGEGGACVLNIHSDDPEIFKGLSAEKVEKANLALRKAMRPYRAYTMNDRIQWCIAAIPSPAWALKIYPALSQEAAMEALWDAIFDVTRMKEPDPAAAWRHHLDSMAAHRDFLNNARFSAIHLKSANGTDLTVGLADDHLWEVAEGYTPEGYRFLPNVPTEEVYTAPHRERVNGTVAGTKPYVYNGDIIDGFTVTFENGRVISHTARVGNELLESLLSTDEGACRIGEIALVPYSSPISQKGLLFYSTLFDENAACHIAFGAGYPGNVKGGTHMDTPALLQKGVNDSVIHDDVMVGAPDSDIDGICEDGSRVPLFRQGEWVI